MRKSIAIVLLAIVLGLSAIPEESAATDDLSPVVLITGANRGLGLEMAQQYSEAGWTVIGTARKPDSATDLKALGVRVLQLDVTEPESVVRLAAELDGQPIDLLINNAGILPRASTLSNAEIEVVARALEVNTLGPMRVTKALLPNLSASERRMIINVSSDLGSLTQNESGRLYGYRESKAALNMFT